MKGLIYKDLSLIGRQGKFFIVYIVLMVAIFSGHRGRGGQHELLHGCRLLHAVHQLLRLR